MQPDFVPAPDTDIVFREKFEDWAILFNPDTADAVGVNPVGAATWKLIDGKRSIIDIVEILKIDFDDVPDGIEGEIIKFVSSLIEFGFAGTMRSLDAEVGRVLPIE